MIVIVIGGTIAGVFTATEGSVIAVVYSLILSLIYGSIKLSDIPKLLKDREELGKAQSVFLWYFSFDFPHHLNIKPTVKQLNRCVTKRIRPMEKL